MTTFDIQRFEGLAKENGVRYWDSLEFMRALGYESWPAFKKVINNAIASCARLGIEINDVFISHAVVTDGKVETVYKLTRFACLLVTMHADSKKPEVAQAKVALAAVADALIERAISEDGLERIEIRDELKSGEQIMSAAAKRGGLDPSQFGIFKDAGIRGMYNMPLRQLVAFKGAPTDKTLYDFMGKTELAANLFRVTQTAERISNNGVQGLNRLADTAREVGQDVRDVMLKSGGIAPEHLPIAEDIADVKKRLKTTHKEMVKLDKKRTSNALPSGKKPTPEAKA